MKLAVLHDYFASIGGGETEMKMLVEGLAKKHKVHFYTSYFNHNLPFKLNVPLKEFGLSFRSGGLMQAELAYKFSKLDLSKYDAIITENYWSVFAKHKNHIHHCETPIRQFYDLRGYTSIQMPLLKRILYNLAIDFMIPFEQKAIKEVKILVANSEFTKTRIKMYYNRDSVVIYPPIITKKYKYKKTGNYFLYVGRLDFNKRIEFMVKAFKKAKVPLIVIGSGPYMQRAKQLAKGADIKFLGYTPEKDVIRHYAECMATVYLPIFEDFGQVPVESMSAGKPCLGVKEGGLLETIIHNKTGWLMLPRMEDVVKKIREITPSKCRSMRRDCEKRAKKFDIKPYLKQFERVIKQAVE